MDTPAEVLSDSSRIIAGYAEGSKQRAPRSHAAPANHKETFQMRSRPDPTRTQRPPIKPPGGELAVPLEHGRARIARLEDALAFLEESTRDLDDYDALRGEETVTHRRGVK